MWGVHTQKTKKKFVLDLEMVFGPVGDHRW